MGYSSKTGRRPDEYASKSAHRHIINDSSVAEFLGRCDFPKSAEEIDVTNHIRFEFSPNVNNPIKYIIAIDGGYTLVPVKDSFPSSTVTFFQFGALIFSLSDLDSIGEKPFIDPDDMAKLKNIQRLKLTIPTKNILLADQSSLIDSVRRAIYDFFINEPKDGSLIETLKWFLFREYSTGESTYKLSNCPTCATSSIDLHQHLMSKNYIFKCPSCKADIYLTDVFRFHEVVDNELGAEGILGYLMTLLEQILLVHLLRIILLTKPSLLSEILFIKDGPLAFFGQTANMFKPMRDLLAYLLEDQYLFLAGLEKSGAFVDHANEISKVLKDGTVLIIDNDYIYRYILPGKADPANPYGRTTYYGNKIIFKASDARTYVISLPTKSILTNPVKADFKNIDVILNNIDKLKCDMYESSLVPVALANKLVSLSNHPSSTILKKFAKGAIGNK
jgi:hypothetical protein